MIETIEDIVREMREQRQFLGAELCAWADRIEAAAEWLEVQWEAKHFVKDGVPLERFNDVVMELANMRDENAKLKAALDPVLECKHRKYHDGMIVWDGNTRCAVLKSQQIYKEGANK